MGHAHRGLRALGANWDGSDDGIFTDRVGTLTNDFFTVPTSMDYAWQKADEPGHRFRIVERDGGAQRYTTTRNDLLLGANSQLRAVAEIYASADGRSRFVRDFVAVWTKVMMADRFDCHS